jgi:hypothetical protein
MESYIYRVTREPLSLQVTFHAVDTAVYCGLDSCLDLLHFIWTHYDRFSFVKYVMFAAFLDISTDPITATELYLQHHKVESEGLRNAVGCGPYTRSAQRLLRPISVCLRPAAPCFYGFCVCDIPPSSTWHSTPSSVSS